MSDLIKVDDFTWVARPLAEDAPDPADTNADGRLTVKELQAALDELGVEFPSNTKKADLQALYDASKAG